MPDQSSPNTVPIKISINPGKSDPPAPDPQPPRNSFHISPEVVPTSSSTNPEPNAASDSVPPADPSPAADASAKAPAIVEPATNTSVPDSPKLPDELQPEPTPKPPATPTPPPVVHDFPTLGGPSATVEPFESGGRQPEPEIQRPSLGRARAVALFIIVLLVLGGGGYAAYAVFMGDNAASPAETDSALQPATSTKAFEDDVATIDTQLGDLGTNLNDADTTLSDKQGDVSE